jgi:hypothetical protein
MKAAATLPRPPVQYPLVEIVAEAYSGMVEPLGNKKLSLKGWKAYAPEPPPPATHPIRPAVL